MAALEDDVVGRTVVTDDNDCTNVFVVVDVSRMVTIRVKGNSTALRSLFDFILRRFIELVAVQQQFELMILVDYLCLLACVYFCELYVQQEENGIGGGKPTQLFGWSTYAQITKLVALYMAWMQPKGRHCMRQSLWMMSGIHSVLEAIH